MNSQEEKRRCCCAKCKAIHYQLESDYYSFGPDMLCMQCTEREHRIWIATTGKQTHAKCSPACSCNKTRITRQDKETIDEILRRLDEFVLAEIDSREEFDYDDTIAIGKRLNEVLRSELESRLYVDC